MKVGNKQIAEATKRKDSNFLTLEDGENRFRIASPIHGVKEHVFKVKGQWRRVACPVEMMKWKIQEGEAQEGTEIPHCPICALPSDTKENKEMKSVKTQFMALAIKRVKKVVDGKEVIENKPGVLKKGSTIFGVLAALNEDSDWGDITKYDIKIVKAGEGLDTEYQTFGTPQKSDLTEAEMSALMALDIDLDKMTTPRSAEDITKIMNGEAVGPTKDDEEFEKF